MKPLRALIDPFSEFLKEPMKLVYTSSLREPHLQALSTDRCFTENHERVLREVREGK